jgi:alpha-tubulin suppressor-like RCC1 family protein
MDAGSDANPAMGPEIHAKSIAIGVDHACALLDDDRVACWGANKWGQLGDGTSSDPSHSTVSLGAVIVPGLTGVSRLVGGSGGVCLESGTCVRGDTTCAILGDGTAKCWGLGAHGELGNGKEGRDYFEASPVALGLSGIVDLAVGGSTGCAVLQGGTVSCWGSNPARDLGFTSPDCGPYWGFKTDTTPPPMTAPCEKTPRAVDGIHDAAHVAVSGSHQCVIHSDASVTCWGNNTWGQLGNGKQQLLDNTPVAPGAPIAGLSAREIELGSYHTCAIRMDGSVACWGANDGGQLGLGNMNNDAKWATPTPVPGLTNAKSLSLFEQTSVATVADGTASAWGEVSYLFQNTPDPTSAAIAVPTKMESVDGASTVLTSHFLTCVLHTDHGVSCRDSQHVDTAVKLQAP